MSSAMSAGEYASPRHDIAPLLADARRGRVSDSCRLIPRHLDPRRGPARRGGQPLTLFLAARLTRSGEFPFLVRASPPTCPASTPAPVTAWTAVAGAGVIPRTAPLEA